ncbi:hypothetical protein FOA52_007264 [Chlamydomonas sp. UWO 241]|nr:hypothetical protein FOA52_007264 [Chlamydomonas sp. UWO 241]
MHWRIENFSKLSSATVVSDSFEAAGSVPIWLRQTSRHPDSLPGPERGHVGAEVKVTLVNQTDASKSRSTGDKKTFGVESPLSTGPNIELSALKDAAAGWLVNGTLVLTADITVQREDRFQLDTSGVPSDVTLKLPCGAEVLAVRQLLQMASPFFCGALEDVDSSSANIPVDGSLGTWSYLLSDFFPHCEPPPLTWRSVRTLFAKLLTQLVAFVKENEAMADDPEDSDTYVITWLALAERLQLDELRELCLANLRSFSPEQLKTAISIEVLEGSGAGTVTRRVLCEQVRQLGPARDDLLLMLAEAIGQP